jgi:RNA polymerase sigma factor (TIGR02999 family)
MASEKDKQRAVTEELMTLVYDELRQIAQSYLRRQPPGFTLRPTEMVNEACLNLIQHSDYDWQSPEHFRAIASRKIWQVVVDHVRRRNAQKRGGTPRRRLEANAARDWQRVPLEAVAVEWRDRTVDLLDLADAMEDLRGESGRLADVVTLHWFGGLRYADTAKVLGVSVSTVEKDFRYALAWLNRRLTGGTQTDGH